MLKIKLNFYKKMTDKILIYFLITIKYNFVKYNFIFKRRIMSSKQTFGFTSQDFVTVQRISVQSNVSHFASALPSTFGQSDPTWKFPTTYTTLPGSNFGSYFQTFGVSNPSWTFNSK